MDEAPGRSAAAMGGEPFDEYYLRTAAGSRTAVTIIG
jgi:hypothetical protein